MSTPVRTSANLQSLKDWIEQFAQGGTQITQKINALVEAIEQIDAADNDEVRIESYTPYLNAANSWLPIVEARIRGSLIPEDHDGDDEPTTEWLSEDAANAAIAFFRNGADMLPTEPHIYGTDSGDLVAEFETSDGSITSVVSYEQTVLFAVPRLDPHKPIQAVILRGSNRYREELRSFTTKLTAGSHGKMETAE